MSLRVFGIAAMALWGALALTRAGVWSLSGAIARAGAPMLSGVAIASALIVAQYTLGRAARAGEFATRASLLVALPSFARALETADLLSHAFVALLGAVALACAFAVRGRKGKSET